MLATRAREKTIFYVATHDQPYDRRRPRPDEWPATTRASTQAREILLNILATKTAPLSATEMIAAAQDEAASLSMLVPRYVHALREYAVRDNGMPAPTGADRARKTWQPVSTPLPWLPPVPTGAASGSRDTGYLEEAAALIDNRVDQLAETTLRDHPAWLSALGRPPQDPDRYAAWLANITIVAAYRDQCRVTVDDPRDVLCPHLDQDQSSYAARRYAIRAVQAARNLAAPESAPIANRTENSATRLSRGQHLEGRRRVASRQYTGIRSQQQGRASLLDPTRIPPQQVPRRDAGPRML